MMIIHKEEVVLGMQDESKHIVLDKNVKDTLEKVHHAFSGLHDLADADTLNKIAETEGNSNRIILESMGLHPLVDLESMGYNEVEKESISYIYIPKNNKVDSFCVDTLVLFFKHKENGSDVSVTLPFYLVSDIEKQVLILSEPQTVENMSLF